MKRILQLLIGGLAGALGGYGFMYSFLQTIPKESVKLLFGAPAGFGEGAAKVIVGLVGLWAGIAVHELAHLLTGLAVGFRFYLYIAGYLGVRRNARTDKVEWYMNRDASLFGGVAATIPTKRGNNLRQKLAAVCAAGPLASFLTGALATGITYYSLQTSSLSSPVTRVALVFGLIFGLISLLLFLATTVPSRTGPFFTDRARFFRLIGGGHDANVEQALLELLAHSQSGLPYADLDADQIALLSKEPQPFIRCYAHTLAYYRHLDRTEWNDAFDEITTAEGLLDKQPLLFKNEVWKEAAFAQAFIKSDAESARQVWERINPAFRKERTAQLCLTQAAITLAERQPEQASQLVQEGLQALPNPLVKSEDKLYKKLLGVMQERVGQLVS